MVDITKLIHISDNLSRVSTNLTNNLSDLLDSKGVNLIDNKVYNIMEKFTYDISKLQRQTHKLMDIIEDEITKGEIDDLK